MNSKHKPLIRWAGSKKQILANLSCYWKNNYNLYIEPFSGSASLFFFIEPKFAVLGDINHELINTYLTVKKNPLEIYNLLKTMQVSKEFYYYYRSLERDKLSEVQKAARFIYLNRFCFNGLYRTNKKGDFNVPFAGNKGGRLPSVDELIGVSKLFENVKFYCLDFQKLIEENTANNCFIYLDPPYVTHNVNTFTQYWPETFQYKDLNRLVSSLELIEKKDSSFVLTYVACDESYELFKRWYIKEIYVNRYISGFINKRKTVKELIISNIKIKS